MSFRYTTEYNLGRRGRICRSYTGIQALIAIGFDLALGVLFALVGLAFWLVQACVLTIYRIAFALISLPVLLVRALSAVRPTRRAPKPAWASFDEL